MVEQKQVHILGRRFLLPRDRTYFNGFIEGILYFSYRVDFPEIVLQKTSEGYVAVNANVEPEDQTKIATEMTSDRGWGCMLRSGQMLLARAICSVAGIEYEKRVFAARYFLDFACQPFSVHNLVATAKTLGVLNGDFWFGPSATACIIKKIANSMNSLNISVYIPNNNLMDLAEIRRFLTAKQHKALLILINTQLGIGTFDKRFQRVFKKCLKSRNSVGAMGGPPAHATYIVGVQENSIYCADPHMSQKAFLYTEYVQDKYNEFKCTTLKKILIEKLDPSITFGFLFKQAEDFEEWISGMIKMQICDGGDFSIFSTTENISHEFYHTTNIDEFAMD